MDDDVSFVGGDVIVVRGEVRVDPGRSGIYDSHGSFFVARNNKFASAK